jgi:hypothetical protein
MVAFNFQKRFAGDIRSTVKKQTIRARQRCKPGDRLQLYTGQRTKYCEKLGDAVCSFVCPVEVTEAEIIIGDSEIYSKKEEVDHLAREDGFSDFEEMKTFFRQGAPLPYRGFVHCWRDFTPVTPKTKE